MNEQQSNEGTVGNGNETPEISSRKSEKTPEPTVESEGKKDSESHTRKGNGNRSGKRTSIVKKNAEGIRGRTGENKPDFEVVRILRRHAEIRDLQTFRERMLEQTSGFGGLRSQVDFCINAVRKLVFENCSDDQLKSYIFTLGISRAKMPEVMERVRYYIPLFAQFVEERIKSERDWRDQDS